MRKRNVVECGTGERYHGEVGVGEWLIFMHEHFQL